MKIILVGYGAMGQRVAALSEERGYKIEAVMVPEGEKTPYLTIHSFKEFPEADVVIDFSHPNLTLEMLETEEMTLPLIIATTGEKEKRSEERRVGKECRKRRDAESGVKRRTREIRQEQRK